MVTQHFKHRPSGSTTRLTIIDSSGMTTCHQRPTNMRSPWMLRSQACDDSLCRHAIRYGLDAANKSAFFNDEFAGDSG
jgi:hypothetical protein